ncbi:MAG: MFS transporter [Defluviitaleaceae bacterium]|nr:MFS transporter [Defluviitaleaceae bacterium]
MRTQNVKKISAFLLPLILFSYLVVGFPDGAFTISWDAMQQGLGLVTFHSGIILVGYSVTYTLAGVMLSWLNRFMKLQSVYLMGLVIMALGFVGLAFSINFPLVLATVTIYGFGTGAMASSMNAYMAKHFTASQNNWMHFFWGAGAAISPLIMGRLLILEDIYTPGYGYALEYGWTAGYLTIAVIVGVVGVVLLLSMYRKIWISDDGIASTTDKIDNVVDKKRYLVKKWHQVVEVLTFFFLGGTDYTVVFFTSTVFMVEHGLSIAHVAIFSTVYYVGMTLGRLIFGWSAKFMKEITIIRIGIVIAATGILVLWFASGIITALGIGPQAIGIVGMAIAGFGLGPLLPTLVSDTSNRFAPRVISKLVGYELAAFGAGIAVLFFITSMVLTFTTYMSLFPIVLAFVILVCICNEILIRACVKNKVNTAE